MTRLPDDQTPPAVRLDLVANPESRYPLIGFSLALVALTLLRLAGLDAAWRIESMALICVGVALAAWSCPTGSVIMLTLTACLAWAAIDLRQSDHPIDEILRHALRTVCIVSIAIISGKARQSVNDAQRFARIDFLTGLINRRAIMEELAAELSRQQRFKRSFSLAMIDCDGFKAINDEQGHLVGDEALQMIGAALRNQLRAYDSVGKFGGDEFVLILPETSPHEIPTLIERLRNGLREKLKLRFPALTFSIGVVTVDASIESSNAPRDAMTVLNQADQAMYEAKRAGRDLTRYESFKSP